MDAVSGSACKSQMITHILSPQKRPVAVRRCCESSNSVNRLGVAGKVSDECFSVFQDTFERSPDAQLCMGGVSSDIETLLTTTTIPSNVGMSNGMRAGLFRTPISGAVQSVNVKRHTRNLLVDPRCSLFVQIPGWSGLSNARLTIFGDVYPLPEDQQEWAHKLYISKHQQRPSQQRVISVISVWKTSATYTLLEDLELCRGSM